MEFEVLVHDILNENQVQDGFENIRFDIHIDENIYFKSDPRILNIIFHNLIENAIKFHKRVGEKDQFVFNRCQKLK